MPKSAYLARPASTSAFETKRLAGKKVAWPSVRHTWSTIASHSSSMSTYSGQCSAMIAISCLRALMHGMQPTRLTPSL